MRHHYQLFYQNFECPSYCAKCFCMQESCISSSSWLQEPSFEPMVRTFSIAIPMTVSPGKFRLRKDVTSTLKSLALFRENKKDPEKQRTRNKLQFEVKRYNTKTGRNSFTYKATMIWNSIPDQIKEAENVQNFKTRLKQVRQTINNFTFQKGLTGFLNKENDFKYY